MSTELHGTALRQVAAHWNGLLSGGYIQQLRSVGEEKFVLKVHTQKGNVELLIALPAIVTQTARKWSASEKQPGFVNATKKALDNVRITKIIQHGLDRILVLECGEVSFVIELFGKGNLILVDKAGSILAVHHAKEWKTRTLKRNHTYQYPPGPLEWSALSEENPKLDEHQVQTAGSWLVTEMGVPKEWVDEICERAEVSRDETQFLSDEAWKRIRSVLKSLEEEIEQKFWISESEKRKSILPLRAHEEKENTLELEDVFAQLDVGAAEELVEQPVSDKHEQAKKALEINLARQKQLVETWKNSAEELHAGGEWVYTHFELVENLLHAVKRAREQKVSDAHALHELKKVVPQLVKVNVNAGTVELEIEEK